MRITNVITAACVVGLITLASCGRRPVTLPELMLPPECEILPGPAKQTDTVRVALFDVVDPHHAPKAHNAGERLVFGHLYETLIAVDCLGEMWGCLAGSWKRGEGGRRWTFELREGARFWDGTPVTARDVILSWGHTAAGPVTRGAGIDSVVIDGERTLHVHFERPHRKIPRILTASAFAVAKRSWESYWPLGSGPYRIAPSGERSGGANEGTITALPAFGVQGPIIKFAEVARYDARDLLEGAIDCMVTADPAVIEYAAHRPRLASIALPWDRAYVLLSTSRLEELRWGGAPVTVPQDLWDRLARDAVRGDARGHRSPSWWYDLDGCGDLSTAVPWFLSVIRDSALRGADSSLDLRRIIYDSNDPVARDLAERIVALAATDPLVSAEAAALSLAIPGLTGGTATIIAEGVTESELGSSLRAGDDFAYIVSVPLRPHDPCHEARALVGRAPWLAAFEVDLSEALIPLVETRRHVLARSGAVGLLADWYGNILIANEMLLRR
ncbi:MAG: hypothetical protein JSV33_15525 [bacterium]|nr:MAG: hypothetical protein JSV33_15525 [bacterium]